ncbi:MAG: STAS domain-containing protein [Planctomycetes bacterium]|nr:STAS domain-containing protein [Planctomycetota bacterium]
MPDLTIDAINTGEENCVLLNLTGPIDGDGTNQLKSEIDQYIDHDVVNIILDMSNVEYVSSSGIRYLVASMDAAKAKGGMLSVTNPHPNVKYVLKITGLADLLVNGG